MLCQVRHGEKLFLGLLVLGFAGCQEASSEAPQASAPKVTVSHPEKRELVDEDDYSGWLRASETVEVRARVRGHIKQVHFVDGALVEKDQLLFELDPDPFQVEIDAGKAQARALEAQKNAAEKDVARYTELVKSGGATQQQLEKAQADAQAYEGQIAAKMEEVERYELDLKYSRVTAPISGRISRAMLTQGNLVNAGGSDPLLTTIVAIDPIHAYFNVDERSLQNYQKMKAGAAETPPDVPKEKSELTQTIAFRFALDSDEGFPHEGLLDYIDNVVDSTTGTIEVRGTVRNERAQFTPGSRIRVRIPVSRPYQALLVPDIAVNTEQDQKYLLVVDEKNEVKRRNIRPGRLLDDGMRVVQSATPEVTENDWIIVEGRQRARLNYPVEPVPDTTQTAAAAEPASAEAPAKSE